jgi:hypothetical protein
MHRTDPLEQAVAILRNLLYRGAYIVENLATENTHAHISGASLPLLVSEPVGQ